MTGPDAPAFPETKVYAYRCTEEKHDGAWVPPISVGHGGLTKREYFAACALQGIIVWDATMNDPAHAGRVVDLAAQAVRLADALIAALTAERKE